MLPKYNDQLNSALKYLSDNNVKPDLHQARIITKKSITVPAKINISIIESS